jgi:hypothetical protein
MPSQKYVPLIKIGPFSGIDATDADPFETPDMANLATNVNPWRQNGAMATAAGRGALTTISLSPTTAYINAIVENNSLAIYASNNSSNQVIYFNSSSQTTVFNGIQFAEGVSIGQAVFTNTGQQLIGIYAFTLQQPAPAFTNVNIGVYDAAGAIPGASNGINSTFYYAFTNVVTIQEPGGNTYSIQETSPSSAAFGDFSNAPQITPGNSTYEFTLAPAMPFSGYFADGSSYVTNVYRLSTDQPQWYFVGVAEGTTFTDNNTQTTIAANAVLDLYRDPPPAQAGAITFAFRDRLWFMVESDNESTLSNPSLVTQLWYSDYGLPYEFNGAQQVLLVGAASNENTNYGPNPITQLYPAAYTPIPGDFGQAALAIPGGVTVLFKKYSCYLLEGTDETNFFISDLAGVGCKARKSPAVGPQGVFWLSERGPEMWQLGYPVTYIGEPIRSILATYDDTDLANAVGWYSDQSYWLSFPTQNTTFVYRIDKQKWWGPQPYAASSVSSLPAESSSTPNNRVVAVSNTAATVHPNTGLVFWNEAETDVTNAITATWTGPLSDSGAVWMRKFYRYVTVGAPIQTGVTATVYFTAYDMVGSGQQVTLNFDLSVAAYQTQSIPANASRGYYGQVTITLNNSVSATAPAIIYNVVVSGEMGEALDQPT